MISFKKWKNDPFELISNQTLQLDTTNLQYHLWLNIEDSTWIETSFNHFKYYNFTFPTFEISDIEVKDYAFREPKKDDDIIAQLDLLFFAKNQPRYQFNNESAIKELLDIVEQKLHKKHSKLILEDNL